MYGVDSGSAEENRRWGKQAVEALAALDNLRVVQPGEVVLSAEEALEIRGALDLGLQAWRTTTLRNRFIDALALLASGPDREDV